MKKSNHSDDKVTFRDRVQRLADDLGISFKMFYGDGLMSSFNKKDDKENIKLIDESIRDYKGNLNTEDDSVVVKDLCTYLGDGFMIWKCERVDKKTVYSLVKFTSVIWYLNNGDTFSDETIENFIIKVTVEDSEESPIELTGETLEFKKHYELESL